MRSYTRQTLEAVLPGGKLCGREYIALNPTRTDRRPGSLKFNLSNGLWADWADSTAGASGKGLASLIAYLERLPYAAARHRAARIINYTNN